MVFKLESASPEDKDAKPDQNPSFCTLFEAYPAQQKWISIKSRPYPSADKEDQEDVQQGKELLPIFEAPLMEGVETAEVILEKPDREEVTSVKMTTNVRPKKKLWLGERIHRKDNHRYLLTFNCIMSSLICSNKR